jgi:plasmid stability protein
MKTMTVRNIPDEVARLIKGLAETTNTSLNTTVVRVLADGVLPTEKRRPKSDFSKYCGGWSQKEFDNFESVVVDCERINHEGWK